MNILDRQIASSKVTSDFEVSQLHIGVNYPYQLPHAGGFFFINGIRGVLYGGRRVQEGDLGWDS